MTDQPDQRTNFGRNDREVEADDRRRHYDGSRQPRRDQDSFQQRPQYNNQRGGRGGGGYRGRDHHGDHAPPSFNQGPPDFRNQEGAGPMEGEGGQRPPAFRPYPQHHQQEDGQGFDDQRRGGRGRGGRGGGRGYRGGRGGFDGPQTDGPVSGGFEVTSGDQPEDRFQQPEQQRFGGGDGRRGGYGYGRGRGGRGGNYHHNDEEGAAPYRRNEYHQQQQQYQEGTAAEGGQEYDRPPREFQPRGDGEGRPQYRAGPKRYDAEIRPLRYEQRDREAQQQPRYDSRRDPHHQQAQEEPSSTHPGVVRVTRNNRYRRINNDEVEVEQLFVQRHNQKGISFDNYESIAVEIVPPSEPAATFASLKVEKGLAENLARCGYERPTPVQKFGIPVCLEGSDLMACAQTGSGKTAAFLIPVINHMLIYGVSPAKNRVSYPIALVMAPTRELALQIYDEARKLCFKTDIYCDVVYGGKPYPQNCEQDLLVACPGRLKDMYDQERVSFAAIKFLILDEADRMLEMGFEEQIEYLVASRFTDMPPPDERQTLMFSATFPKRIRNLAQSYLRKKYSLLTVGRVGSTTKNITQVMLQVQEEKKQSRLLELLYKQNQTDLVLVFVETRRAAEELFTLLYDEGIPTSTIHGDRKQYEREEALKRFKEGKTPILVATDVASRGLDIPDVSHVIQYDLPHSMDDYTHRIGRTGRAGNKGTATSFFNDRNMLMLQELCSYLSEHEQDVPQWMEDLKDVQDMRSFNQGSGGRGGGGRGGNNRRGGGGGGRGGFGGGDRERGHREERPHAAPAAAAPKPKRAVVPKCDVADGGF